MSLVRKHSRMMLLIILIGLIAFELARETGQDASPLKALIVSGR